VHPVNVWIGKPFGGFRLFYIPELDELALGSGESYSD